MATQNSAEADAYDSYCLRVLELCVAEGNDISALEAFIMVRRRLTLEEISSELAARQNAIRRISAARLAGELN